MGCCRLDGTIRSIAFRKADHVAQLRLGESMAAANAKVKEVRAAVSKTYSIRRLKRPPRDKLYKPMQ